MPGPMSMASAQAGAAQAGGGISPEQIMQVLQSLPPEQLQMIAQLQPEQAMEFLMGQFGLDPQMAQQAAIMLIDTAKQMLGMGG